MPWKEDGKGGLAVDNGAPVWVAEDGEAKCVDYEVMTKRLADVTKESIERVPHACGDEPPSSSSRPCWRSNGGCQENTAR